MVHPKAMTRPEIKGKFRSRLQNIKNRMIQQCYDRNHPKYKNYGARGVTVTKKWHRLKGFLEDFDKIDGWEWYFYIKGEEPNPPKVYKATSGEEEKLSFYQSKIEKFISDKDNIYVPIGSISKKKENNKSTRIGRWEVSWYPLPC